MQDHLNNLGQSIPNLGHFLTGPSVTQTEVDKGQSKSLQEYLKENRDPCRQRSKNKGNCRHSSKLRIKRSELSLRRISDLQFFEFGERTLALSSSSPMIQAHGVGGPGVGEGGIFLSANNTVVETHKGTDTTINCRITRDSDYGTVSYKGKHTTNAD